MSRRITVVKSLKPKDKGALDSDGKFYFTQKNGFAAMCLRHGFRETDIVNVEARSSFNVAKFAEKYPTTYNEIAVDLERGYYTNPDDVYVDLHTMLYTYSNARMPVSFVGKAEIRAHLPDKEAKLLYDEARSIRELLQQPMGVEIADHYGNRGSNRFVRLTTSVSMLRKEDKNGNMKKIPQVNHCFHQVRPLVLQHLLDTRSERENLIVTWKEKPTFSLYWS